MQALVFADRLGKELLPLTDRTCVALLPVVGKPILEHCLEALTTVGVTEVILVVCAHSELVQEFVGDGGRWGLAIELMLSRGEEPPEQMIYRLRTHLRPGFLALRGDVVRGDILADFLERADQLPDLGTVYCRGASGPMYLCQCRQESWQLDHLLWQASALPPTEISVQMNDALVCQVDSLQSYHRLNLDALAGRFPGIRVPGRQIALGLTVGRQTQVALRSLKQGVAFIGAQSRIHRSVELTGEVVVSSHCIIDRHATLRDSVVLPHTYIGELLDVRNAIVRSNDLIRVDNGAILRISETFLLADLRHATLMRHVSSPINRLGGALLLMLSLPLWPVALLAALGENPDRCLHRYRLRGNKETPGPGATFPRQDFFVWEWNTSVPILRYLPWLGAVVLGHLRLVGTFPLTPSQADGRYQEWELLGDQAPAGLMGPTHAIARDGCSQEDIFLSNAYYARQRSIGRDLCYLLKGSLMFFSGRAWWLHRGGGRENRE